MEQMDLRFKILKIYSQILSMIKVLWKDHRYFSEEKWTELRHYKGFSQVLYNTNVFLFNIILIFLFSFLYITYGI